MEKAFIFLACLVTVSSVSISSKQRLDCAAVKGHYCARPELFRFKSAIEALGPFDASGIPCPVGRFCIGGSADKADCTCDVGYYCPEKSHQTKGEICPAGYFCAGRTADKVPCTAPIGRYCPSGTTSRNGEICPDGHYCAGGTVDKVPCTAPSGRYCPAGATSIMGEECPEGHYCTGGQAPKQPCTCPPGKYCPSGSSDPDGIGCPVGHFCKGGQHNKQVCSAAPGFYCPGAVNPETPASAETTCAFTIDNTVYGVYIDGVARTSEVKGDLHDWGKKKTITFRGGNSIIVTGSDAESGCRNGGFGMVCTSDDPKWNIASDSSWVGLSRADKNFPAEVTQPSYGGVTPVRTDGLRPWNNMLGGSDKSICLDNGRFWMFRRNVGMDTTSTTKGRSCNIAGNYGEPAISRDGEKLQGRWTNGRPDFSGSINANCEGQMTFPDDKTYPFSYNDDTKTITWTTIGQKWTKTAGTVDLPYTQHKYSSTWDNDPVGYSHGTGRLDSIQAWSAARNALGEWMQLDASQKTEIRGVTVGGRIGEYKFQYVTSFTVSASDDGNNFLPVDGGKTYPAITSQDGALKNVYFDQPIQARYVRIQPTAWVSHISMRAGLILT